MDLLRSQLERCGPEQLTVPADKLRKVDLAAAKATAEASAVAVELRLVRQLLLGTLVCASIAVVKWLSCPTRGPLALAGPAAGANLALENVPRWSPPEGNRARRL